MQDGSPGGRIAPDKLVEGRFSAEWAELEQADVEVLLDRTRSLPWREALEQFRSAHPAFVSRITNPSVGDWSLLLRPAAGGRAIDIGCGFGVLTLGLASRFDEVVGVDILPARLIYASLLAKQTGATRVSFVRANALALPTAAGTFDIAILNGVLEWAGLVGVEDPVRLQVQLLCEVHRVLSRDGVLAIAIENRYALETLTGTPDTHTGVHLLPLLPRWIADRVYRYRRGEPLRSQLHSARAYQQLLRRAGFTTVRLLDLVPSYNDCDFVIGPGDAASYRLLWQLRSVRSFNRIAGRLRAVLSRMMPWVLGRVNYAYLVIAGRSPVTLLDDTHTVWDALGAYGISPGRYRFGCSRCAPHSFAVVSHDGRRVTGLVEIGPGQGREARADAIPNTIPGIVLPELRLAASIEFDGALLRAYVCDQLTTPEG